MCRLKCLFKVFVIGLIVKSGELISITRRNGSIESLWNLTNYALQSATSAQGRQYGFSDPQRPAPHFGTFANQPYRYPPPHPPPYAPNPPVSVMDALYSIASNDELHCVPKLLCELTSNAKGSSSHQQQSLLPLPFNVNMDSLLGLLSVIGPGSSPLFLFGRAALLGYTSSDSGSCYNAFQRCPTDPNQLVHYLNNYNGGFFRYFNGAPHPHPHQLRPPVANNQFAYPFYNGGPFRGAQQRILSAATSKNQHPAIRYPAAHYGQGEAFRVGIKFPVDDGRKFKDIDGPFYEYKSPQALTFPETAASAGSRFSFGGNRAPKKTTTFTFPNLVVNNDGGPHHRWQKPLPNHVASPLIFPTRTGTGELLLDSEEIDKDFYKNYYNRL